LNVFIEFYVLPFSRKANPSFDHRCIVKDDALSPLHPVISNYVISVDKSKLSYRDHQA